MIKLIKKFITGDFIDDIFNSNSSVDSSVGDVHRRKSERSRRAQARAQVAKAKAEGKNQSEKCPYKVERLTEGDCV